MTMIELICVINLPSAGVKVISQLLKSLNIYEYIFKECVCAGEIFESVCLIFIVHSESESL